MTDDGKGQFWGPHGHRQWKIELHDDGRTNERSSSTAPKEEAGLIMIAHFRWWCDGVDDNGCCNSVGNLDEMTEWRGWFLPGWLAPIVDVDKKSHRGAIEESPAPGRVQGRPSRG